MTSIKCPQCGLIYWSTSENCRRCGLLTEDIASGRPESYVQPATVTAAVHHNPISDADAETLLGYLKRDSRLFYFIGGVQILAWFFMGNLLIVDGACNIGLSYLANKFKSRIAACILLLLTLLSVMVALLTMFFGARSFNLFIPLIVLWRLWCSGRMVYTTFKLNAYEEVDVTRMMPPLPPLFRKEDESQWAQPIGSAQ